MLFSPTPHPCAALARAGNYEFLELWASHGGSLDSLASTPEDADDMPGAEVKAEEKGDFIDSMPVRKEVRAACVATPRSRGRAWPCRPMRAGRGHEGGRCASRAVGTRLCASSRHC